MTLRLDRFTMVLEKPVRLGERGRTCELLRDFMDGACRDAGRAHDAGIDVMKVRTCGRRRPLSDVRTACVLRSRCEPGSHVTDFAPERGHVDGQVFDDRKVSKRRDRHHAVPFPFPADRGAAGQLFRPVDLHRAGAANCRPAGIAKSEAAVVFVFDADERIEHGRPASDIEVVAARAGMAVDFRVEPLDKKGQAHKLREA